MAQWSYVRRNMIQFKQEFKLRERPGLSMFGKAKVYMPSTKARKPRPGFQIGLEHLSDSSTSRMDTNAWSMNNMRSTRMTTLVLRMGTRFCLPQKKDFKT